MELLPLDTPKTIPTPLNDNFLGFAKFLCKASGGIDIRDRCPSISHNISEVLMLKPHTFKVDSISTLKVRGSMKRNRYKIERVLRRVLQVERRKVLSQFSEIRNRSSLAKVDIALLLDHVKDLPHVGYQ